MGETEKGRKRRICSEDLAGFPSLFHSALKLLSNSTDFGDKVAKCPFLLYVFKSGNILTNKRTKEV